MDPVIPPPPSGIDPITIAKTLWGILMSVAAVVFTRYTAKIDALEKNSVTREELQSELAEMKGERRLMHEENKKLLENTGGKIDRVDQQLRRLAIQVARGGRQDRDE